MNAGLLANVTLRHKVNSGSWTTMRQVGYVYYDGTQSYGNTGDLMKAIVKDAAVDLVAEGDVRLAGRRSRRK